MMKILFKNDKTIVNKLNHSIYPILYFYPVLVFVQAISGGLLCKLFYQHGSQATLFYSQSF
jgi:hypothetical protein